MSSNIQKIKNLVQVGDMDGIIGDLCVSLFASSGDKKEMNRIYFQQEGGLDMLMKVYNILVSKEWGDLGIDKKYHSYLEGKCSLAVCNYVATVTFRSSSWEVSSGDVHNNTAQKTNTERAQHP